MFNIYSIAIPVLTVIVAIWYFARAHPRKPKNKEDHATRQGRAVWAWAKVLASTCGTVNLAGQARVEMQIEVHMPGTPAYPIKVTWLVDQDALPSIEPGQEISLKVDPLAPQYVYPNGPWARFVDKT